VVAEAEETIARLSGAVPGVKPGDKGLGGLSE